MAIGPVHHSIDLIS
jgi:hypothetical protein